MTLSVPIRKHHSTQVKIVFLPFDASADVLRIAINVATGAELDPNAIGGAIADKIGRIPQIAIGTRLTGGHGAATIGGKLQSYSEVVALETPDPEKWYAQASVRTVSAYSTATYLSLEDASRLFLLEFPTDKPSAEEIAAEVERRLGHVWGEGETVTGKFAKTPGLTFAEGEKFKVSIGVVNGRQIDHKQLSPKQGRVFDHVVSVVLNPAVPFSVAKVSKGTEPVREQKVVGEEHSLDDCFEFLREPEELDEQNKWYCPHCKDFVQATKTVDIWKVPEVLVIQLKRFIGTRYQVKKFDTYIDFPDELDMAKFIIGPQRATDCKYRLYAVSNHMGGLGGGHYTAHAIVQDPFKPADPNPKWYSFNDSSVGSANKEAAHSAAAYILFYEKVLPPPPAESEDDPIVQPD
jgi:hypothetical protein